MMNETERLRALNTLMANQLQASAYRDKDFALALNLLAQWLGKFKVENPFPCGECGRKSADDDLRVIEARLEDGRTQTVGCVFCNTYRLVCETHAFLSAE